MDALATRDSPQRPGLAPRARRARRDDPLPGERPAIWILAGLTVLLVVALLAAPARAGSSAAPEIEDLAGDASNVDALDIQRVWFDASDPKALKVNIAVKDLDAWPADAGSAACSGTTCAWASLTYRVILRVEAPDGGPAPAFAGYNATYIGFRWGPDAATLATPIGWLAADGTLAYTGTSNATIADNTITLSVPRSDPALNIPAGDQPGAYRLLNSYAYDSPQACGPVNAAVVGQCAPLYAPGEAPTLAARWDQAPDTGFGSVFVFPAPPPTAAAPTPEASPVPTNASMPEASGVPSTNQTASPTAEPLGAQVPDKAATATPLPAYSENRGKGTPGLGAVMTFLAVASAAVACRRS